MRLHKPKRGLATAVRLLLAPVLTAGIALPAYAQKAPVAVSAPKDSGRSVADAKELLKRGREELKAGRLDRAAECAKQAETVNKSGRWGLFDDTPEALRRDILSARAKADKAESARLTKGAKELFAKPASTPGERIANLDQAFAMADRAAALHGPSDMLDSVMGGDRPDKLKREIDLARIQIRKNNPTAIAKTTPTESRDARKNPPVQVAKAAPTAPTSKVVQASANTPMPMPPAPTIPPVVDETKMRREKALQLTASGRACLRNGDVKGAKAKADEAAALGVNFSLDEDSPASLLREATAQGKMHVDMLVGKAEVHVGRGETAEAEKTLAEALQLSTSLGLHSRTIENRLAAVRRPVDPVVTAVPETKPAVVAPTMPSAPEVPAMKVPDIAIAEKPVAPSRDENASLPPLALPGMTAKTPAAPTTPTPAPTAPTMPNIPQVAVAPTAPVVPSVPTVPTAPTGRELLDQAAKELKAGDTAIAMKLARQAHNSDPMAKAEAQDLIRTIEAEDLTRKRKDLEAAIASAEESVRAQRFDAAAKVLVAMDGEQLPPDLRTKCESLIALCKTQTAKIARTAATDDEKGMIPSTETPKSGLADQVKALSDVEFQKLRAEGLEVEAKARDAFNRGETDLAVSLLTDFIAKVKGSTMAASRQGMLVGPVERRLESFRIVKRQVDFVAGEAKAKRDAKELVVGKQLAEQQKREEIAKKVREVNELAKAHKYQEAEKLALQLKTLDPNEPVLDALYTMARTNRRIEIAKKLKSDKEIIFVEGLNDAEHEGKYLTNENPIHFDVNRALQSMGNRVDGNDLYQRRMSPMEREIELRLDRPVSVEFKDATMREVVDRIRTETGMNITVDDAALQDEEIKLDTIKVTESIKNLSLRNVLSLLLDKGHLKYVIAHDAIRITTERKSQGRLVTKVFSVMELVTPVPDFALPDHLNLSKSYARITNPNPGWTSQTPNRIMSPGSGLGGGQLVSGPAGSANAPATGGQIDNQMSPMNGSATLAEGTRQNTSVQLMKLITGLVRPYSWQDLGGPGKLDYYDIGGALVVNQTADVIREVDDLLNALRKLQETSIAVEVRVISLSESFYEKVGVDFSMNLLPKSSKKLANLQSDPRGVNNVRGLTLGWNPEAGGFAPDFGLPIRPNSFGVANPPFGNYPGPGLTSPGLGLGLAFLNDIQVFMFLEAAAGDQRINVMQAPRITMFNGQTATVTVSDIALFSSSLSITAVGGQVVYTPQQTPVNTGVSMTIQGIVSADRRYVRMNMAPQLNSLASTAVPLLPVTAFITPVFESGSQGQPVPFTQFLQQPNIQQISVQTTVQVPDGGTVVMGGLKTLAEGRNEFGPPVLSQIPYLNRLFKNTGVGRDVRNIMIMVTPRIIIQSEEEFHQVGTGALAGQNQ